MFICLFPVNLSLELQLLWYYWFIYRLLSWLVNYCLVYKSLHHKVTSSGVLFVMISNWEKQNILTCKNLQHQSIQLTRSMTYQNSCWWLFCQLFLFYLIVSLLKYCHLSLVLQNSMSNVYVTWFPNVILIREIAPFILCLSVFVIFVSYQFWLLLSYY